MTNQSSSSSFARLENDALFNFPCVFPIKAMGLNHPELLPAVTTIALRHDHSFKSSNVELRKSKTGKYLSITLNINAISRAQLDALYSELSSHELIEVVL